jgi:AcrR family transcriptional regulator
VPLAAVPGKILLLNSIDRSLENGGMSPPSATSSRWEPTARWEHRYLEVLDAAATAFAEKGFVGASTRDIADRLGIRAASLYYYLPSKEAALAAICELSVKDFIKNLTAILEEPIPAPEKIRRAIANHLRPLGARPAGDYIRVFLLHRHELPNGPRQVMAQFARKYQSLIERIFVEGVAAGELRAELNPQLATLAMLGLCNSVIITRALPRASGIDDFIEEYSRIVTYGVIAGSGTDRAALK